MRKVNLRPNALLTNFSKVCKEKFDLTLAFDQVVECLDDLCNWCEATDADSSVYIRDSIAKARAALARAKEIR